MSAGREQVELLEKNRPRQARAKRTYEAILEAAAGLLLEIGVERISTNLIAERARSGDDEGIVRLVHGLARYPASGKEEDLLSYSSAAELSQMFEGAYRSEVTNDR